MTGRVDLKSNYILINVWSPHSSPLVGVIVTSVPAPEDCQPNSGQSRDPELGLAVTNIPRYTKRLRQPYISLSSQIFSFQFSIIQLLVKENSQCQENFLVLKKLPPEKEVSPWSEEL